jgi:TPR repeat protein
LAAEQGDANAQNLLGYMYAAGRGVLKDYIEAHMWFSLAGAGGAKSTESRDSVAKMMTPEQIAEAQRRAKEWKAKDKK